MGRDICVATQEGKSLVEEVRVSMDSRVGPKVAYMVCRIDKC